MPFDGKRMIYGGFGSLVKVWPSLTCRRCMGNSWQAADNPLALTLQSRILCNTKLGCSMRDLDKALADILAIRSQIAAGTAFRGYGPATIAATGGVALLTAILQFLWLDDPTGQSADVLRRLGRGRACCRPR